MENSWSLKATSPHCALALFSLGAEIPELPFKTSTDERERERERDASHRRIAPLAAPVFAKRE